MSRFVKTCSMEMFYTYITVLQDTVHLFSFFLEAVTLIELTQYTVCWFKIVQLHHLCHYYYW